MFHTVNYTIAHRHIPEEFDGFRIAHLSDLHGAVYGDSNKLLIQKIHQASPHIIAMTGDMADHDRDSISGLLDLCRRLLKRYPVYYTPGNHEQGLKAPAYRRLLGSLEDMGVTVLENRWRSVSRRGAYIKLYGLVMPMRYYKDPTRDDYARNIRFTAADARRALGQPDESCYTILLSHNPLYYPACRDWGADLTLSGHIHGGIIRIPGLGGLLSPDLTFFPRYDGGHFQEDGKHLIVSRGLGNHFFVRVLNPPELVIITLACPVSRKEA